MDGVSPQSAPARRGAMRFAVVLYILASCFLTASVTHCLTRSALEDRIEGMTEAILKKMDSTKELEKMNEIRLLSLSYRMHTGMACELAFLLAAPLVACLYGAISIHRAISRGRAFSMKLKLIEMLGIFLLALLFVALGIPC